MLSKAKPLLFCLFLTPVIFTACQEEKKRKHQEDTTHVRIGLTSEPDALNPVTFRTIDAQVINNLLFQKLLEIDRSTLELTPVLASSRPEINSIGDSLYTLQYSIQKEAIWDDGTPVTAKDVVFTLKASVAPNVSNEGKKSYLSSIQSITYSSTDPKSITFTCTQNMRMEYATGAEVGILPAHIYDPEDVLNQWTFQELFHNQLDSTAREKVKTWAGAFNSPTFQRNPDSISGSGAYQLQEWVSDRKLVLERKTNYWADDLTNRALTFEAFPQQISYRIIKESPAIVKAARNGQIDIGPIPRSADYIRLKSDSSFLRNFELYSAPELSTNVILVNACQPDLSSTKTRQALAHLFHTENYIASVQKSTGKRIIGPLHPSKKEYHDEIVPYQYDVNRAIALLNEDGWSDSDGDGILDKKIGGEKVDLKLEYKYNTGHEGRKNAGLLFKEWARPAGVEISLKNEEWLVFIESLMAGDYELAFFSWTDEHAPTDPIQLFHSRAINSGYNFGCFDHPEADTLMEELAITIDDNRRTEIWHKLQEIFHREVASIFLSTNEARFFMSREFETLQPVALPPGYWPGDIQRKRQN